MITTQIEACVDKIWGKYDLDGSGDLDKEEVFHFITDTMKQFGSNFSLSFLDFNNIFKEFDKNGSGTGNK